jgi:Transposase domain (DUF772)
MSASCFIGDNFKLLVPGNDDPWPNVWDLKFCALGFQRAIPASTGRPAFDRRDLLKLYVYGYLNEVRSSRRLERECRCNLQVLWLVRRLARDHKTIANFPRDNGRAIVGVCRAFVRFCRDQGLFTADLVGGAEVSRPVRRVRHTVSDYGIRLSEGDRPSSFTQQANAGRSAAFWGEMIVTLELASPKSFDTAIYCCYT